MATSDPNLPTPRSISSASLASEEEVDEAAELEIEDSSSDTSETSALAEGDPHPVASSEDEEVGEAGTMALRVATNALVTKFLTTILPVTILMVIVVFRISNESRSYSKVVRSPSVWRDRTLLGSM